MPADGAAGGVEKAAGTGGNTLKKVLFLTLPMKGHLVHTVRLAEWFLQFPEEYEVHIGAPEEVFGDLPEGVKTHASDPIISSKFLGDALAISGHEGTDWYHSQMLIFRELNIEFVRAVLLFGVNTADAIRPDVVVSDHTYNMFNALYTMCRKNSTPYVMITSMGRPETLMDPMNMLTMICRYFSVLNKTLALMEVMKKEMVQRMGVPLVSESIKPITIFPSTEALVQSDPGPNDIFTGPFLPLPGLLEEGDSIRRQSSFSMNLAGSPELQEWLERDEDKPIIYVALGTLVSPSKDVMKRLVEGLDGGNWRILWALPQAHQANLPHELGEHWFTISFAPQFALLKSKRLSAFLSHCGANSTMESLCQGVPMICMPFFGDQYEWSESICKYAKAGILVDKLKSTPKEFNNAVVSLLSKPEYKENADKIAQKMLEGGRSRLQFLQKYWVEKDIKIERMTKVGLPVAASVIDAMLSGADPHARLPQRPEASRCCF